MPDITNEKKRLIRGIAEKYCSILSKIPFENGVRIYSKTYQTLHSKSARWKLCLLCGEIKRTEDFKGKNHEGIQTSFYYLPILVKTSWIKLQDFFLSEIFIDVLTESRLELEEKSFEFLD